MSGDEEQVYFVHGTTTALWAASTGIEATRGGGDFGAGFYVFEDTSWGRQAAASWAYRKALVGGAPILVRVAIARSVFEALDREDISDDALDTAYQLWYARVSPTGRELLVGPVGVNGPDGRRVPDRRWPVQYKFEGAVIAKLTIDSIEPLGERAKRP
jgi:hypothetical protein